MTDQHKFYKLFPIKYIYIYIFKTHYKFYHNMQAIHIIPH
jgi:hypothetical protein